MSEETKAGAELSAGNGPVEQPIRRLTKRQKRVKAAIEFLKDYYLRYDKQIGYLDYTDKTLIDDALYGLGAALDPNKYKFANGYDEFKRVLREHLKDA